jgi:lytic murein transglycosylase
VIFSEIRFPGLREGALFRNHAPKRTITMRHESYALILLAALAGVPTAAAAQDANCRNTGSFDRWLADFKKEASAQGISAAAINAASPYLVLDQRIIGIDRGQRFFSQNFLEFSDKMLAAYRLQQGAAQIKKYQPIFAREEKDFGVPAAVITAFWGLESDFGAGQGKDQAIKSLTTLAYDCRRSDMFRGHLFDVLRIIERGDLRADEMIGSWAGELGQTQMMPSEYYRDAVIYDGGTRRDLIKSAPNVIDRKSVV